MRDTVRDMIDGLREAFQMMTVGDVFKFWVPPSLAFGDRFALLGQFYPYDVLAIEIKLLAVDAAPGVYLCVCVCAACLTRAHSSGKNGRRGSAGRRSGCACGL